MTAVEIRLAVLVIEADHCVVAGLWRIVDRGEDLGELEDGLGIADARDCGASARANAVGYERVRSVEVVLTDPPKPEAMNAHHDVRSASARGA